MLYHLGGKSQQRSGFGGLRNDCPYCDVITAGVGGGPYQDTLQIKIHLVYAFSLHATFFRDVLVQPSTTLCPD